MIPAITQEAAPFYVSVWRASALFARLCWTSLGYTGAVDKVGFLKRVLLKSFEK